MISPLGRAISIPLTRRRGEEGTASKTNLASPVQFQAPTVQVSEGRLPYQRSASGLKRFNRDRGGPSKLFSHLHGRFPVTEARVQGSSNRVLPEDVERQCVETVASRLLLSEAHRRSPVAAASERLVN